MYMYVNKHQCVPSQNKTPTSGLLKWLLCLLCIMPLFFSFCFESRELEIVSGTANEI